MIKHRFLKYLIWIFSSLLFLMLSSIATTYQPVAIKTPTANVSNVGSLKGNFQVTPTGQANYSIPIEVPPGTAGITPALSIVYDSTSSNTRNGLLGMGFSLEGLSTITRCPSNRAQNGLTHGVDLTYQDRFCLNGEQLVAVKGAYGADGTEYRTYIDSKIKIVSYKGLLDDSPSSFEVWTKGGQIVQYGDEISLDSQIKAAGKHTNAIWSLSKIRDTAGNYLEVHYFKDEIQGSFYPTKINYTGNEKTKLAPYNSIEFVYENRPDEKVTYQAGSKSTLDKRLKAIYVYQASRLIYKYNITYETSKNTFRSRITTIQKCTGSGVCLPATKFIWQESEDGWVESFDYKLPDSMFVDGKPHGQLVDLNGDGLPDFVIGDGANKRSWLNNGAGWTEASNNFNLPNSLYLDGKPHGQLVDLNGDGLPDFTFSELKGGVPIGKVWFNKSGGWVESSSEFQMPDALYVNGILHGQFVDLNSDGLLDFVCDSSITTNDRKDNSYWDKNFIDDGSKKSENAKRWNKVWFNKSTSWEESNPEFRIPGILYGDNQFHGQFVDLDGDGLPDFVPFVPRSTGFSSNGHAGGNWFNEGKEWKIHISGFQPFGWEDGSSGPNGQLIDLNGDGLPDFVINRIIADKHDKEVWFNTGDGWTWLNDDPNFSLPGPLYCDGVPYGQMVDFNGDGLHDFILAVHDDGNKKDFNEVWFNSGNNGFVRTNITLPSSIVYNNHTHGQLVDLNGDGLPDFVVAVTDKGNVSKSVYLNKTQKLPDYLVAITDGFGSKISIDYEPLSGSKVKVYTKENDAQYPNMDWQGPMYVVYETASNTASNAPSSIANNGQHTTRYHYTGARFNHLGWGFLGFHKVTSIDKSTGITTTITYSQNLNFHNKGMPVATETKLADGTLISSTEDIWDLETFGDGKVNNTYYFPYVKTSIKKLYDLKGKLLSATTLDNTVDDYGNPLKIIATVTETVTSKRYTTITQNTYHNNLQKWFIGELIEAKVNKTATDGTAQTRTSSFKYDSKTSLLMETTAEPDDPKLALKTKYKRDGFGNIISTTISGEGIESRTNKVRYDDYGRFIVQSTNPLNQSISQIVDPRFGAAIETTDLNGLKTIYQYDDFGRQVGQISPDGIKTNINYSWFNPESVPDGGIRSALKNCSYIVTSHTQNSTTQNEYFDVLGRKVAATTQNMDGEIIWQLIYYDELGRVMQKTLPFFAEDPIYYNSFQYDVLGRVIKTILPDKTSTEITYDGFTTTSVNQLKQKQMKKFNAIGELIKTIDSLGSVTTYKYDAYGNMIAMIDSEMHESKIEYDRLGRKIAINDPDKGHWTYQYDVLNNLTSQTDALGHVTTFKYDRLNRIISRTDPAGISNWEYDTAPNGIGKLSIVNSLVDDKGNKPDLTLIHKAIHDGLETSTSIYNYDTLSRLVQEKTAIRDNTYAKSYSYDKNSRVDIETYPNGLKVKNHYNELGFLVKISDVQTGKIYWSLNAKDAAGHTTSESHSNGSITNYTYDPKTGFLTDIDTILSKTLMMQKDLLPEFTGVTATHKHIDNPNAAQENLTTSIQKETFNYDAVGNIKTHHDTINNIFESFQYDKLNRLTKVESADGETLKLRYDLLGNIIYKSDVGTYKYAENGAGIHAVTNINGKLPSTFQYNANGDQVAGTIDGVQRSITYTSYSKPAVIEISKTSTSSSYNPKVATISYFYNADRQKFARVDKTADKTATTYYLGNYEQVVIDNGKSIITQEKAYIGPNTIYIKSQDSNDSKKNTAEIYEMLHNNLGSVTDITDSNANVTQHFTYTPFGEQKQTKGAVPFHPVTYKGFTGHEEIEGTKLIHMDGRIYDPVIGRFLSADPFVQDPSNSQSLNRYSYCINNPLALTDPTGFGFFSDVWRGVKSVFNSTVGRIVIGVGLAVASYFCPPLVGVAGAWWKAAIVGGVVTSGLGLAAGVGIKQAFLEGLGAFAISAGALYTAHTVMTEGWEALTFSGNAGSGSGISFGVGVPLGGGKGGGSQGGENSDPSSPQTAPSGSPNDSHNYQNEMPRKASDRTDHDSNYSNGAGSSAYKEMSGSNSHTVEIDMQRIASDDYSTLSTFTARGPGGRTVDGYMLEPAGPSSLVDGSNRRIPAGTYHIDHYSGSTEHQNQYIIFNKYVHKVDEGDGNRHHILIHPGNSYGDTHGCIVPGSSYSYGKFNEKTEDSFFIKNSRTTSKALYDLIGNNKAIFTIKEIE